jgi:hypothetical protein
MTPQRHPVAPPVPDGIELGVGTAMKLVELPDMGRAVEATDEE